MAKVQGSPEALNQMANQIRRVIQQETATAQALQSAYRAAGSEWNDAKYRELGSVVNQAVSAIQAPIADSKNRTTGTISQRISWTVRCANV